MLFAGWSACAVDRSGLFPSSVEQASGGHTAASGGNVGTGTGGMPLMAGSGGTLSGTGGTATGGTGGWVGSGGGSSTGGSATGGTSTGGSATGGTTGGNHGKGGVPGSGGAGGNPGGGKGGAAARGGTSGGTGSGGWNGSGSGGWNGSGSGGWSGGLPMCDPSIRDKDACTFGSADCRKTCGVSSMGTKPCTCSFGAWSCGDCTYPTGDYGCYRLPAQGVASCPAGTINGSTSCTRACSLCSGYRDTTGADKVGYCACTDDQGSSPPVYHCASTAEWPPQ